MEPKTVRMHGCGNSFIVIDDFQQQIYSGDLGAESQLELEKTYHDFWDEYRKSPNNEGFQPDGLLFVLPAVNKFNPLFRMKYFDVDRSSGEAIPCNMCGNGIRSFFRYVYDHYQLEDMISIITDDGPKTVSIYGNNLDLIVNGDSGNDFKNNCSDNETSRENFLIEVEMGSPRNFCKLMNDVYFVDTSIGHVVYFLPFLNQDDKNCLEWVRTEGRRLRFDTSILNQLPGYDRYEVNFVNIKNQHNIEVVTYEAGIEDLTLACGTGATASAYVAAITKDLKFPIKVKNPGGELIINLKNKNLYMIGPAEYLPSEVGLTTQNT